MNFYLIKFKQSAKILQSQEAISEMSFFLRGRFLHKLPKYSYTHTHTCVYINTQMWQQLYKNSWGKMTDIIEVRKYLWLFSCFICIICVIQGQYLLHLTQEKSEVQRSECIWILHGKSLKWETEATTIKIQSPCFPHYIIEPFLLLLLLSR